MEGLTFVEKEKITLTYKADFGFSVFVNRLKNQIVSEGPSGLK